MRTREQIEADLALRFSVPDFVGWQRAIGRIADDVPALLAALDAAEARAEQAESHVAQLQANLAHEDEKRDALQAEVRRLIAAQDAAAKAQIASRRSICEQRDAAVQALERVKALHHEATAPELRGLCAECWRPWPCAALAALSPPSTEPSGGSDE